MWMQLKLAWRNIFRNKRRTVIAGIAIGIGLASMIFTDALILGMEDNMIRSATASFLGEGQIHREGFRETYEVDKTIEAFDSVYATLQKEPAVAHVTPRVMTLAMISSPANVTSVQLVGVDPLSEQHLSQIDEALTGGAYFEGDNERDLIIGSELADVLEVGQGDRIVITAAQAQTGDLAQEMFRVSGIYHFNIKDMDKGMAFVRIGKAREMLNLGGRAHEIAMTFADRKLGRDEDAAFWQRYSKHGNEAVGWTVLLPQLEAALEMSSFSTWLVGIILFSVVALGIVNTLFMSLYERMFEFGVMRAVGTSPLAMGRLILFEAGALAVVSIVLGTVLGWAVTAIVAHNGIDYSGIEFAGATFRDLLYPQMKAGQFIRFPFWVFVFTTVIGLYPAWHAAKMNPAEAMRKSF